MLNLIFRNKTVWSFKCVYEQNPFTNHIFDVYVKIEFSFEIPTMVDMP